jgi:hypothetical protein
MLRPKRDHLPRPESAERPLISIGAMAYAQVVRADFKKLETGYRNGLYNCIGKALISYRKFLKDEVGYKALLSQDNIAGLPEKPELKTTSRLVLYFHTNAQNEAQRNTAGKYARIVDYLHKEHVENGAGADYVQSAGGIAAILKKARGREALNAAHDTRQDDDRDLEEPNETRTRASADEIFDPDQDLSIRVKRETLERVLGSEVDMEESFYLECRKKGSAGRDGIRIEGRLANPE